MPGEQVEGTGTAPRFISQSLNREAVKVERWEHGTRIWLRDGHERGRGPGDSDEVAALLSEEDAAALGRALAPLPEGGDLEHERFMHAACLSIAEGVPGWEKPIEGEHAAQGAVRKLRRTMLDACRDANEAARELERLRAAGVKESGKFSSWALFEAMGHRQVPGLVDEVVLAGKEFLRVRVPDVKRDDAGRPVALDLERLRLEQLYRPDTVYCLTPTTESAVLALLAREARYLPALPPPGGTLASGAPMPPNDGAGELEDDPLPVEEVDDPPEAVPGAGSTPY